jgi:hypothetical protein
VGVADIEEGFHCAKTAQWRRVLSSEADTFRGANVKKKGVGLLRSK